MKLDVAIIGAGPSGAWAAAELARHGAGSGFSTLRIRARNRAAAA